MGNYITQTDVEQVAGARNVAIWSNLDSTSETADTTRIATAITNAEAEVDDYFRGGRYLLPFSPVPQKVKDWSAKLAALWLYEQRSKNKAAGADTDKLEKWRAQVEREMGDYWHGARKFSSALSFGTSTAPMVIVDGDPMAG